MKRKEFLIKSLLFVLSIILFAYHMGSALPIIESEKFYFQSVKEMFARHDWLTPYYQGRFRFQKPILFYWLVSLSYLVFGINNFAVRFPSAILGAITAILTFNIGRKLFDRKTGLLAACVTATFALFFMYARYASPDMALTFFITYSLYLFLKGVKKPEIETKFFVFFFMILGLATLNKGYVGFVLPLIVVSTFLASSRKWKIFRAMNIPLGIFIIIIIAMPWYLLMYKLHGEQYLNQIFVRETLMRIFYAPDNERGAAFLASYLKRIFYYVPVLLAWLAPYSLFLPAALVDAFKSKNTYSREKDSYKFILSFFFGIFLFFTLISVKEYHYMLPITPAAALIIARYLVNLEERGAMFRSAGFKIMYLLITIVYTAILWILLYAMKHLYPAEVAPYEYIILSTPLILILPYIRKRVKLTCYAISVAMGVLMLFLGGRAIPLLNDDTMPIFANEINKGLRGEDKVGVGSLSISQQRLGIYLDRNIEEVNIKYNPPEVVAMHMDRLRKFLTSGDRVYLVISKEDYTNRIPDELKPGLTIIDKRETWKTRLKRSFSRDIIEQILRGEKDILKDVLREEVYLLTNKEIK